MPILALFFLVAMLVPAGVAADETQQSANTFTATYTVNIDYLLYTPDDVDSQEKWPLVLFLHGAGERGDNLERVKVHGPPKLVAQGKTFPFFVVSPQCPADSWWDSRELLALLDHVMETKPVDPDRVYVTGLSMGGYGTWKLLADAPDRFAAAAPICGGGIPYLTRKHPKVPVWVFHGAKDFVVPLSASEAMIEGIKKNGGEPRLTVYPEAGHDSWTESYNNEELYDWLLSHSLSDRKKQEAKK